jgi:DNA-binding transcriptional LysR family regulator
MVSLMPRPDYNLLLVLRALMEERSVTRAAARLGLTQSSMSNALNRLRAALGDRVLEREGNVMVPTTAARALWGDLEDPLRRLEAALVAHEAFDAADYAGEVRIAIDDYALEVFGSTIVDALSSAAPLARFSLVPYATNDDAQKLFAGEADILVGPSWGLPLGLKRQTLVDETFVGMVDQRHDLAGTVPTLAAYLAYPHVLVSGRGIVSGNVDAALRPLFDSRRVDVSVPTFASAPAFLIGSSRILNLGRRLAAEYQRRYPVAIFELPVAVPGFNISLVWHPRNSTGALHSWVRDVISRRLEELEG